MIYSDIIHFIFKNTPKKLKIITIFVTKMEYNFCLQYNDKIADLKNPAKNVGLKTPFSPIKCKIFDTKITIYLYRPKKKLWWIWVEFYGWNEKLKYIEHNIDLIKNPKYRLFIQKNNIDIKSFVINAYFYIKKVF